MTRHAVATWQLIIDVTLIVILTASTLSVWWMLAS